MELLGSVDTHAHKRSRCVIQCYANGHVVCTQHAKQQYSQMLLLCHIFEMHTPTENALLTKTVCQARTCMFKNTWNHFNWGAHLQAIL